MASFQLFLFMNRFKATSVKVRLSFCQINAYAKEMFVNQILTVRQDQFWKISVLTKNLFLLTDKYHWMQFFRTTANQTKSHRVFSLLGDSHPYWGDIPLVHHHFCVDEHRQIHEPVINKNDWTLTWDAVLNEFTTTSWNGPRHWQPILLNLHIVVLHFMF